MGINKTLNMNENYFEEQYSKDKAALYKKNLLDLYNEMNNKILTKDLKTKILNFISKFEAFNSEFTYENVVKLIKEKTLFGANFIKEPSRQNVYEKTALRLLKELTSDEDLKVQKLPNKGPNSLYVIKGVVKNNLSKSKRKQQKSIDFEITLTNLTIYIAHKYTGLSGGSQDNQKNDLSGFISHANKNKDSNIKFLAIADGPYYKNANNSTSELDLLKKNANKEKGVYYTELNKRRLLVIAKKR
jgi:hypothetical protein